MKDLFWGYQHCSLTCEISQNITIKRTENISVPPTMLHLYTQRWQRQVLKRQKFDVNTHTYESRALIDTARQYTDSDRLRQFAQWLIGDQPHRRFLFFILF